MSGVFVTGTGTGVGKTVVACALARGLRARDLDVGVMKPAETGVTAAGPEDARALREAAGVDDDLELVCPQTFALPAAPSVAAAHEGRRVDLAAIDAAYETLRARHRFVVVEGAGGLLVPVTGERCMADLAARLKLPVLVVARGALGTIHDTLATLEALHRRDLVLAGVVISHGNGPLSEADALNLRALTDALIDDLVGVIPPLEPGETPREDALRIDAILARAGFAGGSHGTGPGARR